MALELGGLRRICGGRVVFYRHIQPPAGGAVPVVAEEAPPGRGASGRLLSGPDPEAAGPAVVVGAVSAPGRRRWCGVFHGLWRGKNGNFRLGRLDCQRRRVSAVHRLLPLRDLHRPAGRPLSRQEPAGQVHPRPAALPRRGPSGRGAVRHGGPGHRGQRPVVRPGGHRQGVGPGGRRHLHCPHPGGVPPGRDQGPLQRRPPAVRPGGGAVHCGRPQTGAGHRPAQPQRAGDGGDLPAPPGAGGPF